MYLSTFYIAWICGDHCLHPGENDKDIICNDKGNFLSTFCEHNELRSHFYGEAVFFCALGLSNIPSGLQGLLELNGNIEKYFFSLLPVPNPLRNDQNIESFKYGCTTSPCLKMTIRKFVETIIQPKIQVIFIDTDREFHILVLFVVVHDIPEI